jgi:hypothetical protein
VPEESEKPVRLGLAEVEAEEASTMRVRLRAEAEEAAEAAGEPRVTEAVEVEPRLQSSHWTLA